MVSSLNISLKYCVCKQVVGTNIMKGLLSSFSLKNISFFLVYGGLLIKISPKSFLWQGLSTVGRFFGENWSDSRVRAILLSTVWSVAGTESVERIIKLSPVKAFEHILKVQILSIPLLNFYVVVV